MTPPFGSISTVVAGLIPYLFVIWVASMVIAMVQLAIANHEGRSPARPGQFATWHCISNGVWLTIGLVANEAHSRGLISLPAFIVIIVLTMVTMVGLSWMLERREPQAKAAAGPRRERSNRS